MLKIMAVNAGSSSLKFKLMNMPEESVITEGVIERIGAEDAYYTIKINGNKQKQVLPVRNHSEAVNLLLNDLVGKNIVASLMEIKGIGHRIVQGGAYFSDSALITPKAIEIIRDYCSLAPLHNPANLIAIEAFQNALPGVPNVAVFDTSFHQTMEPEAYMYAVPYEWYTKYNIRKYGFHGTSHKYVSHKIAEVLGKPLADLKVITLHIGNGASIAAIKNGKVVDTSMGLTPLEGIPMGTRSGNIDPTIVEFICNKEHLSVSQVLAILNKKSGYLGVSGFWNDSRDLEEEVAKGNARCRLALDVQYKRIVDYIGSYYLYMGGLDVLVFTAGIGENSISFRKDIINRLGALGIVLDEEANNTRGKIKEITKPESKVRAFI
ncbi:MAG TPA: acetate kinase, partial [Bacilli bacterium]|nr:acetate kinase [Bacilli bacterium]